MWCLCSAIEPSIIVKIKDFIKDFKRYGSNLIKDEFELRNLTLNSELDEDIFIQYLNAIKDILNKEEIKNAARRNVLTSGVVATYPFISSSIFEEKGIFIVYPFNPKYDIAVINPMRPFSLLPF